MKRLAFTLAVGLLFVFAVPSNIQAQSFELGPRATISVGDISDLGGDFGIGADARVGFSGIPVDGNAAFTFFFADNTIWTLDLNAVYPFPVSGPVSPYAGVGVGIVGFEQVTGFSAGPGGTATTQTETTTDAGLNIVGGAKFNAGALTPFAELNLGVGDISRFGITGGLLFGF